MPPRFRVLKTILKATSETAAMPSDRTITEHDLKESTSPGPLHEGQHSHDASKAACLSLSSPHLFEGVDRAIRDGVGVAILASQLIGSSIGLFYCV